MNISSMVISMLHASDRQSFGYQIPCGQNGALVHAFVGPFHPSLDPADYAFVLRNKLAVRSRCSSM